MVRNQTFCRVAASFNTENTPKSVKEMRLDKFLSHATGSSRSECRKFLKAGLICVNTTIVKQADFAITLTDQITLHGQVLCLPQPQYYMLHKPQGYVSARTDPEHPTVLDLFPSELKQLNVAGRLDKDTTGLVLLSDDGEWIHRVTSPNKNCTKRYQVTTATPITDATLDAFSNGIMLHSETKITKPAEIERLGPTTAIVTLREGRYHQVKRMFAACGNHVEQLHRVQIGTIILEASLLPGLFRPLTTNEIENFT